MYKFIPVIAIVLVGCGSQLVEFPLTDGGGGGEGKNDCNVSSTPVVDAGISISVVGCSTNEFCNYCRAVCGQ